MTRSEWTLWVIAAAISIAGVSLALFQYFNKRGGRKIKVVRRAFLLTSYIVVPMWIIGLFFCVSNKPLTVSVGDSPLNVDTQLFLVYGLEGVDFPSSLAIPLWIKNAGSQSVENLTITFTYNSDFISPVLADQAKQIGLGPIDLMHRETHSYEGITSSTISIDSLGPGQRFYAAEPFILSTAYLDQLKRLVYTNITINLRISAKDIPVWNCAVIVSALPGTSVDEISSNHMKLSNSIKLPSEIIAVVSPFQFEEVGNQLMYVTEPLHIQTTRIRFTKK